MRILYVFPHPDDESFGPASSISRMKRDGHQVFLLTLTKGGATKMRFKYDYSIEEMGAVRFQEMLEVANVLKLDGMEVMDLPDSGLKHMDPREIENVIRKHILDIRPDIVVTYPVHGISGFHDHLVCHAVVKRLFVEFQDQIELRFWKRLAFFTLDEEYVLKNKGIHRLNFSKTEEIQCQMTLLKEDIEAMKKALDCYKSYQDVIQKSIGKHEHSSVAAFELFQEQFTPPIDDLTKKIG